MKLYHGTAADYLDAIMRDGLRPRGKRKGNWQHSVESNPHCVYLTRSYGPYFAMSAEGKNGALIIEIETARLDQFALLPDEDAVEQATRGHDGIEGSMRYRTKYYRRRMHQFGDGQKWKSSVQVLGTCCHKGAISPWAFTRAVIVPPEHAVRLLMEWDASISLLNQRILGNLYVQKTLRLFDDDTAAEKVGITAMFGDDWKIPVAAARMLAFERGKIVSERAYEKPDERTRLKKLQESFAAKRVS